MKQVNYKQINELLNKQKGFTLIELLIVIVIIGILGTVAVTSFGDKPGKARIASAKLSLKSIETSLEAYKIENGRYPTTSQGIAASSKDVPKDPWGEDFKYISDGKTYEVYTWGADKTSGGTDEDDDIKLTK
jgi:general secretion pathway protein G